MGPVGVSNGGKDDRIHGADASAAGPTLDVDVVHGWKKIATHMTSEHGRFAADVYSNAPDYAEDLFEGDASAGVYLIERGDAGLRFAVADARGHIVGDTSLDAGASLEACVRCHRNARDSIFPLQ